MVKVRHGDLYTLLCSSIVLPVRIPRMESTVVSNFSPIYMSHYPFLHKLNCGPVESHKKISRFFLIQIQRKKTKKMPAVGPEPTRSHYSILVLTTMANMHLFIGYMDLCL